MTTQQELRELQRPLPLKWRVQSAFPKNNPTHVIMVGYIDARDIQQRLDDTVGAENWQTRYFECKHKQFCEIGILVGGHWVFKGDSGSPSSTEKEKGETSDSFKRAAVHWGINRVGYRIGTVKLKCKMYDGKPYPCDNNGNFLKGATLFAECNRLAKADDFEVEFEHSMSQMIDLAAAKETLKSRRGKTTTTSMP